MPLEAGEWPVGYNRETKLADLGVENDATIARGVKARAAREAAKVGSPATDLEDVYDKKLKDNQTFYEESQKEYAAAKQKTRKSLWPLAKVPETMPERDEYLRTERELLEEKLGFFIDGVRDELPTIDTDTFQSKIAGFVARFQAESWKGLSDAERNLDRGSKLEKAWDGLKKMWTSPIGKKVRLLVGLGLLTTGIGASFVGASSVLGVVSVAGGATGLISRTLTGAMATEGLWDWLGNKFGKLKNLSTAEITKLSEPGKEKELAEYLAARHTTASQQTTEYRQMPKPETTDLLETAYFGDVTAEAVKDVLDTLPAGSSPSMIVAGLLSQERISNRTERLYKTAEARLRHERLISSLKAVTTVAGGVAANFVIPWASHGIRGWIGSYFGFGPAGVPHAPTPGAEPGGAPKVGWGYGDQKLDVKWLPDNKHVEIGGQQYEVSEGKYIQVGVDTNHDGIPDKGVMAKVDLTTGRGTWEDANHVKHGGFAWDKDPKGTDYGLSFRTHQMVDLQGDGVPDAAFWVDNGVGHFSHGINPAGVTIDGKPYSEWLNEFKKPDFDITQHKVELGHIVVNSGVDITNHAAVAKDLAHQVELLNQAHYHADAQHVLHVDPAALAATEHKVADALTKLFDANPEGFKHIVQSGLSEEMVRDIWEKGSESLGSLDFSSELANAELPPVTPEALTATLGKDGFIDLPSGSWTAQALESIKGAPNELTQAVRGLSAFVRDHSTLRIYAQYQNIGGLFGGQAPAEFAIADPTQPDAGYIRLGKELSQYLAQKIG